MKFKEKEVCYILPLGRNNCRQLASGKQLYSQILLGLEEKVKVIQQHLAARPADPVPCWAVLTSRPRRGIYLSFVITLKYNKQNF